MEPSLSFTQLRISHHSFMRWARDGSRSKKEERAVEKVFNPAALDDDCMDKNLMLTAFSA